MMVLNIADLVVSCCDLNMYPPMSEVLDHTRVAHHCINIRKR
jgi:hypothetical protein